MSKSLKQSLEYWPIDRFVTYINNPRRNDEAVDATAAAIREFGFRCPVVAKSDGTLVDGHLRLKAAKKLGLDEIPVLLADDMTPAQIKAFRVSVNQVSNLANWDYDLLKLEIEGLQELDFDLDLLGFDDDQLDTILNGWDSDIEIPDDDSIEVNGFKIKVEGEDKLNLEDTISTLQRAIDESGIEGITIAKA